MIMPASKQHYPAIIELWERSVRATHLFLPEEYLQTIKKLLPSILPAVHLFVFENDDKMISGFLGVAEHKIEMLFIHPDKMGQGIGRQLTTYAVEKMAACKVDVNEDNREALNFYLHAGFVQMGRSETDGLGKPYPLVHMELPSPGDYSF